MEPPQQQELQPQEERESGVAIATTAADTATENEGEDVANTAKQSLASCDWLHEYFIHSLLTSPPPP